MNKYFLPVYHSELKPWIKWWILKRLNGGQSSLKAVTLSSGTLTKVDKSKSLSIKEYYGNTVQNGTPTPESPVEIKTISGNITFTINGGDYKLNLKSKNLLDENTYNDSSLYSIQSLYFAYVKMPDTFKRKFYGNMVLTGTQQNLVFGFSNSNNSISTRILSNGTLNQNVLYDFTNAENVYLIIGNSQTVNITRDIPLIYNNYKIMISENENEPYESYYNYELCKIGDYKDRIYNVNGTWKVEKNIGKIVADSSYFQFKGTTGTNAYYIETNVATLSDNSKELSMSNMFKPCSFNNRANGLDVTYCQSGKLVIRTANNTSIDWNTNETAKAWLDNNKPIVYYVKPTTTTETITNSNLISQLNALYEFYVNSSKVTISNNSEIPLEVLLEYYGR